ncbi:MAG: hypothetical protein BGO38_14725 [Cellulomonas sp. 73-145]|mgnify:CR=1 FL=1|nr:MAG: hypothetical protein BGO38_14725 [Cellulomonas sp. 73-145]
MLVVPPVVGAVMSGVTWRHALLLVAWLVAYLAYNAVGLWLRSGRKARYLPPVRAYGIAAVVVGGGLLVVTPGLLVWAPAYAVLLGVSLTASVRRADRSWSNDAVTVLAACLMTVVAAGLGSRAPAEAARSAVAWGRSLVDGSGFVHGSGVVDGSRVVGGSGVAPGHVVLAAVVLLAYFWGTVLYVKTMIRERGRRDVLAWSIGYHVAIAAAGFVVHPLLGAVGVLLAVRAAVVPRRWPRATPKAIGIGEIVATTAVAVVTLAVL